MTVVDVLQGVTQAQFGIETRLHHGVHLELDLLGLRLIEQGLKHGCVQLSLDLGKELSTGAAADSFENLQNPV